MKKQTLSKILCPIIFALAFLALAIFAYQLKPDTNECQNGTERISLTDGSDTVDIVKDGQTDYKIIFSTDALTFDQELAGKLANLLAESGVYIYPTPDFAEPEGAYEILIGNTNRAFSEELYAAVTEATQDGKLLAWGMAYKDGALAVVATDEIAYKQAGEVLLSLVDNSGNLSCPSDLYIVESISAEEYAELQNKARLEKYQELNAKFTNAQFGVGTYAPILGEGGVLEGAEFASPWIYPTKGEHPRLYFAEHDLEDFKELLSDPAYSTLAKEFWKLADANEDVHYNGIFPTEYKNGIAYNYSGYILGIAEAKALAYLLTGDEHYAVEAVVIIKNAMLNLNFTAAIHADTYRGPGHVMCIAAKVYDWCYYALSETDKDQIISGVVTLLAPKLENGMQYPPSGMSGINGHGTGPQLPNSWLSCAIAFFDEVPDWWEFIGGRFFGEYLPAANHQYAGGNVSQGTAIYGSIKLYVMGKAMYMIYALTGENYFTDDAADSVYFMMSHDMSNGRYFQTGDGSRTNNGASMYNSEDLWIAALYNDPVIYAYARAKLSGHSVFSYDNIMQMSPALQLILSANIDYNGEGRRDGVPTIQYFAGTAGQMTAREAWDDPNSITVFMKIGNETVANHDIYDHGTFQIYYKGLLAATSGAYAKYGSAAHYYYLQATVAHNGLLVFNPYFADTNPGRVEAYYYSGSQDRHDAMSKMGETLGAAWGYYEDGSSKYAYISGDLTDAYNGATVSYLGRTMMTLYTRDENIPAIFVTYDKISSVKESFAKTWLLHTVREPEIDADNLSATVVAGGGKMYVKNLFGASEIVKIGGEGKAYWINGYYDEDGNWVDGKNATDEYATSDDYDKIWGRIELRTAGNKTDTILTVMGVTDADKEYEFDPEKFETDTLQGFTYGKFVIGFAKSELFQYKSVSLTTEGKGLREYYVGGLEAGTWHVTVDGIGVAYVNSGESEHMVSFIAPAGEVVITPTDNVIGANGGKIQYDTDGGILPDDAPYTYNNEEDTPLPTELGGDGEFKGWYTSPNFEPETKVEFVPKGTTGTFRVYALRYKPFMKIDYENVAIHSTGGSVYANLDYKGTGTSFHTKRDEDGVAYLEWFKYDSDSIVTKASKTNNLSGIDKNVGAISFMIRLSLRDGVDPMRTNFNFIAKQDKSGNTINSVQTSLFKTTTSGVVQLGGVEDIAQLTAGEVTTLRIVLDGDGFIKYYNNDGRVAAQVKFTIPAETKAETVWEYISCLTEYIFYWYAPRSDNDAGLNIYELCIYEGNQFAKMAGAEGDINYQTGGALLPLDANLNYDFVNGTDLPTNITFGGYTFGGWYTSETFEKDTRIERLAAGIEGEITVYAKWLKIIVTENYKDTKLDVTSGNKWEGALGYKIHGGTGASFKTKTDASGVSYLEWINGDGGGDVERSGGITLNSADKAITFVVRFKITEGYTSMNSSFNLLAKRDVNGDAISTVQPKIFTTNTAGELLLGGTQKVATLSTDKIITANIVFDIEAGTLKYYDTDSNLIASQDFAIPTVTGAQNAEEFVGCLKDFVFYWYASTGRTNTAFDVYEISVIDGNLFAHAKDSVLGNNIIKYETSGAVVPESFPLTYDPSIDTVLPDEMELDGYVFGGWYTTASYDAGTRVYEIPAGSEGAYKIYAKWFKCISAVDYAKVDVDITEKNGSVGRFDHKGASKAGSSFKTEVAPDGSKYLVWTPGTSDPQIVNYYTGYSISKAENNTISYVFKLAKNGDAATSRYLFSLIAKQDVNGNAMDHQLHFGMIEDGVFHISDNGTGTAGPAVFTLSSTEVTVIRVSVNFENGTITVYGDRGEVLAQTGFTAPASSGAANTLEFKKCFVNYNLYIRHRGGQNGAGKSMRLYGISIIDGNPFI